MECLHTRYLYTCVLIIRAVLVFKIQKFIMFSVHCLHFSPLLLQPLTSTVVVMVPMFHQLIQLRVLICKALPFHVLDCYCFAPSEIFTLLTVSNGATIENFQYCFHTVQLLNLSPPLVVIRIDQIIPLRPLLIPLTTSNTTSRPIILQDTRAHLLFVRMKIPGVPTIKCITHHTLAITLTVLIGRVRGALRCTGLAQFTWFVFDRPNLILPDSTSPSSHQYIASTFALSLSLS